MPVQYLQYDDIARSFALYYDLFRHFNTGVQTEVGTCDGFSLASMLLDDPEELSERSSTECLAIAALLFHPILLEAERLAEVEMRLERRAELSAMMPGDAPFGEKAVVRTFFDKKREAVAIKVAHDVMKPEEEIRERSVLAELERDVEEWRKLPRPNRVGLVRCHNF